MILLNYVKKYMQTQYATPQWSAYSTSYKQTQVLVAELFIEF